MRSSGTPGTGNPESIHDLSQRYPPQARQLRQMLHTLCIKLLDLVGKVEQLLICISRQLLCVALSDKRIIAPLYRSRNALINPLK